MPFILVTGTLGDEVAVQCMKAGISDYVLKDKLEHLPFALRRAMEEQSLRAARNRAEQDLRELVKQYRSIIEGAPYGIFRVEQDGHIFMANPALLAMLGYESETDLRTVDIANGLFFDAAERRESLRQFQSPSPTVHPEVTWLRKDGKKIIVRLAGRLLLEKPNGPVYEIFAENITEQRALEAQFQQAQKMEAVGRLAGGMAHDFNNLLMVIGGCAELMALRLEEPEKIKEYIQQIQNSVGTAAGVIRQLLAFSRKQMVERQLLDLNVILVDLNKMLPRLLGEDMSVVIVPGQNLHRIYIDRGQIEQIIMNLAINSRDAMPEGGVLTVETANVHLAEGSPSLQGTKLAPCPYVMLAVSDTGTGMDEETKTHIFEPFFTTKERGKGTGLGLSMVYGIVEQNGGSIQVQSKVGQGTTFRIYFPRADVPAAEPHALPPATPSSGGAGGAGTILVVEDENMLREITREYLQSKGYTVLTAPDAKRALEICAQRQRPIHLLLTDVILPGRMSGPALAREAATLVPGIRTVYVSGYTDRLLDIEALDPTMVLLQKPYSLEELAAKIRKALGF